MTDLRSVPSGQPNHNVRGGRGPDGQTHPTQDFPMHLNRLLASAREHCEQGRSDLAITDLAQAVYQAAIRDGEVESLELAARVRAIISAGGGFA